jgi:metallo-beta-lactamase class B
MQRSARTTDAIRRTGRPAAALLWAAGMACAAAAAYADASGPADSAAAEQRDAAKAAAGTRWENAYRYLCTADPHLPNQVTDEAVEPQWIFDDVALLGDRGTVIYVLKTAAGVMLIDSGYSTRVESLLLPSLAKLGVDPTTIKYVLITHGHPDHFGGAVYLQQHYGARVVASKADWDLMTGAQPWLPPKVEPWMVAPGPTRDVVVADGDSIVLGKLHVRAYLVPGHTSGALGFVFPVKDQGHVRMAALFGGLILSGGRISDDGLRQYVASLAHFAEVTHHAGVEVELENHTLFDDTWTKAAALAARKPGDPNPFVVGDRDYQAFLRVLSDCTSAALAQRMSRADPPAQMKAN